MHEYIGWPVLLQLLQAEGHSQRRIAKQVGVDQATISRVASGATKSLSFEAGERLLRMAGGQVVWPTRPGRVIGTEGAPPIPHPEEEARHAA